jgi:hypothetical protein
MDTPRVFELVVNDEALSVHRSLIEAMEIAADVLPHAEVFIRSVAADPARRGRDAAECFYFDRLTGTWG